MPKPTSDPTMKGYIVLYTWGFGDVTVRHYKTERNATKLAAEHKELGGDAIVINVSDMLAWKSAGVEELERMFTL